MLNGDINVYEIDADGVPEQPGEYLCWTDRDGFIIANIDQEMIDDFKDYTDGATWLIDGEFVTAYANLDEFDLETTFT